ncbi:MAG: GMC family oxidoreductase [Thermoleophilia bacterium]
MRIVVVGAGSAGCVVAARLSEDGDREVVLLEAGPDRAGTETGRLLASASWIDAMSAADAFDPGLMATRLAADAPRPYLRGRGLGGSGSVNAMLALPGLPRDYDGWATRYGLDEWAWASVEPTFAGLREQLAVTARADYTPVDRALVEAAASLGLPDDVDTFTPADGAGTLRRTADATGRRSSLETCLEPARGRANLTIRPDARVDRLAVDDDVVVGVVLTDGTELAADVVVLCAGAIETPAILLRSGCARPGVGRNLQDHPAASILLALEPGSREVVPGGPCVNAVLRLSSSVESGDIHLLAMQGALSATTPQHHGALMAALMTATSTGEVRLDPDDPAGPPLVAVRMLSTARDRQVMREAVQHALAVLETPPFRAIVESAFVDATGTPAAALADPEVYEAWLNASLGNYVHATGTARMGRAEDPGAVVDQRGRVHGWSGVRVIDCSIMPEVPAANTHLPVVMVAERLSAALRSDLAAGPRAGRPEATTP